MDRKVRCPVCRAFVLVRDDRPGATQRCPFCQTSFVLPPLEREAESGGTDDEDPDE